MRPFAAAAGLVVALLAAASAAIVAFARPAPLAIVHVAPPDGASGVPVASRVTVTFNRPLDEGRAETAIAVWPRVDGFASAAGRRLVFTAKAGFAPDTEYVVTIDGAADRGGRTLAARRQVRFRTRGPGLVGWRADGRLVRVPMRDGRVAGPPEVVAERARRPFDVGAAGEAAYVREDGRAVVVTGPPGGAGQTVPLPRGLVAHDVRMSPRGRHLLVMGLDADWPPAAFLARLDAADGALLPFGPRPGLLSEALVVEKLKRSLNAVVYRHETALFTPDGRALLLRDSTYDLALFGLDGERRATLGPFLAAGDVSAVGDAVYVVDVDPADGRLRRQVLALGRDGKTRGLSDPSRDAHAPRVSPDGRLVAFLVGDADRPPAERRYGIEVVDAATGERRRLTGPPPGTTDLEPRWSPDGALLAFRRVPVSRSSEGDVRVAPVAGGEARAVGEGIVDARWSP